MFGELAAMGRTSRTSTVISETDAVLLELRWQGFRDIRLRNVEYREHTDRLYLERGLEAVDFDAGPIAPSSPPAANSTHQVTRVERPEFRVVQHQVHGHHELVNDNRCRILTTIAGNGSLEAAGSRHTLAPGRTVLLPASVASAQLHSSDGLTLLDSHLP